MASYTYRVEKAAATFASSAQEKMNEVAATGYRCINVQLVGDDFFLFFERASHPADR